MALWLNSSCTCVRTWVWVPSTCIKLSKSSFPTGRWGWRYQNPSKRRGQLAWCAQQWTTRELVSNQLEDEARQPGLPSDLHSCATVLTYPHSHKWTCKHVHTSHMHEKVLYLKKSQHRHTYLWFFLCEVCKIDSDLLLREQADWQVAINRRKKNSGKSLPCQRVLWGGRMFWN